jgi:hypothetical protein
MFSLAVAFVASAGKTEIQSMSDPDFLDQASGLSFHCFEMLV